MQGTLLQFTPLSPHLIIYHSCYLTTSRLHFLNSGSFSAALCVVELLHKLVTDGFSMFLSISCIIVKQGRDVIFLWHLCWIFHVYVILCKSFPLSFCKGTKLGHLDVVSNSLSMYHLFIIFSGEIKRKRNSQYYAHASCIKHMHTHANAHIYMHTHTEKKNEYLHLSV